MFCSVIIPTIGRHKLDRAVRSVLDQTFTDDDFEVIIVNDTGQPLPAYEWQQSSCVRIITTNRRERCVARNTGAAVANGRYLYFLDDDDWLLPGALTALWRLAQTSEAHWLYGGSQLVDRQGNPLIQLQHELEGNCFTQGMAGEWVPLQASLIDADAFFAIGGFHPLIPGTEDVDLVRRIALQGDLAGTHELVACIEMGEAGSSTDQDKAVQSSRWAREQIISQPGVFTRLQDSAVSSYWQGRIVRIYLTSIVWNLQHGNVLTALSRGIYAVRAFLWAGKNLLARNFWAAITKQYFSTTFDKGFREAST